MQEMFDLCMKHDLKEDEDIIASTVKLVNEKGVTVKMHSLRSVVEVDMTAPLSTRGVKNQPVLRQHRANYGPARIFVKLELFVALAPSRGNTEVRIPVADLCD